MTFLINIEKKNPTDFYISLCNTIIIIKKNYNKREQKRTQQFYNKREQKRTQQKSKKYFYANA